jgi:hypothetical protein
MTAPASRFGEATPTGSPDGRLRMSHVSYSSARDVKPWRRAGRRPAPGGLGLLPAAEARARSRRSVPGRGPVALDRLGQEVV